MEATDEERVGAIRRLKAKQDFRQHLTIYAAVNLLLIAIWAVTDLGGYFWPVWPIAGWGVGIVLHRWEFYKRAPITESDIQQEIERDRGQN